MPCRSTPAAAAIATLLVAFATPPVAAAPGDEVDAWQRNGALSRHVWQPAFARGSLGGWPVQAGVAVGLRGVMKHQVGQRIAPSLTLQLAPRASVSVLPADGGGAMLVLQLQP